MMKSPYPAAIFHRLSHRIARWKINEPATSAAKISLYDFPTALFDMPVDGES